MGPVARASVAKAKIGVRRRGYSRSVFGRWKRKHKHRADRQEGDPSALEREGDPRGGLQDETYRHADPREPVETDGVAMTGPGGAPQEGTSPEERREHDRS
jgi:hypothetical protein